MDFKKFKKENRLEKIENNFKNFFNNKEDNEPINFLFFKNIKLLSSKFAMLLIICAITLNVFMGHYISVSLWTLAFIASLDPVWKNLPFLRHASYITKQLFIFICVVLTWIPWIFNC